MAWKVITLDTATPWLGRERGPADTRGNEYLLYDTEQSGSKAVLYDFDQKVILSHPGRTDGSHVDPSSAAWACGGFPTTILQVLNLGLTSSNR